MCLSRSLHDSMFGKVIRAPMRFFDLNPVGRVMNRFSKDLGVIDEEVPEMMANVLTVMSEVLPLEMCPASNFRPQIFSSWVAYMLIIVITQPVVIPIVAVLVPIFVAGRTYYVTTSNAVYRLEAVTRSPIFSQLSSSLRGLPTVRAFGAEQMLVKEFDALQDVNSGARITALAVARWFGIVMDLIQLGTLILLTNENYMLNVQYGLQSSR